MYFSNPTLIIPMFFFDNAVCGCHPQVLSLARSLTASGSGAVRKTGVKISHVNTVDFVMKLEFVSVKFEMMDNGVEAVPDRQFSRWLSTEKLQIPTQHRFGATNPPLR
jgi:hypothetical protein